MKAGHVAALVLVALPAIGGFAQDAKPPANAPAAKAPSAPPRSAGEQVYRLAVSADGSRVAAVAGRRAIVWDASSPKALVRHREAVLPYHGIALSADGRWFVSVQPDLEAGGYEATLWSVADSSASVAIFNASRGAAGSRTIRRPLRSVAFDGPGGGLALFRDGIGMSVVPAPDAAGPAEWKEPAYAEPDPRADAAPRPAFPQHANAATFAPDGSYFVVGDTRGVSAYAWPGGEQRFSVGHADAYGFDATVGAGGKVVVAEAQRNVAKPPPKYEDLVVAWDAEGKFLWSRARTKLLAASRAEDAPDVLLVTPAGIEFADATTGKTRCPLPGAGTGTVTAATFSADGRHVWVARRDSGDITRIDVPPRDR